VSHIVPLGKKWDRTKETLRNEYVRVGGMVMAGKKGGNSEISMTQYHFSHYV